jgi:hypothetical protein
MARRKRDAAEAIEPVDDYVLARVFRGLCVQLMAPRLMDADPVIARRCDDALKRGHRAAAKAHDWPGRVAAMAAATSEVLSPERVAQIQRHYETAEPAGDATRRAAYVRSAERAFERSRA